MVSSMISNPPDFRMDHEKFVSFDDAMRLAAPILALLNMHTVLDRICKSEDRGKVIEIECPGIRMVIEISDELRRLFERAPAFSRRMFFHAVLYAGLRG